MKCVDCNVDFIDEVSMTLLSSNTAKLVLLYICFGSCCDGLTTKCFLTSIKHWSDASLNMPRSKRTSPILFLNLVSPGMETTCLLPDCVGE